MNLDDWLKLPNGHYVMLADNHREDGRASFDCHSAVGPSEWTVSLGMDSGEGVEIGTLRLAEGEHLRLLVDVVDGETLPVAGIDALPGVQWIYASSPPSSLACQDRRLELRLPRREFFSFMARDLRGRDYRLVVSEDYETITDMFGQHPVVMVTSRRLTTYAGEPVRYLTPGHFQLLHSHHTIDLVPHVPVTGLSDMARHFEDSLTSQRR